MVLAMATGYKRTFDRKGDYTGAELEALFLERVTAATSHVELLQNEHFPAGFPKQRCYRQTPDPTTDYDRIQRIRNLVHFERCKKRKQLQYANNKIRICVVVYKR